MIVTVGASVALKVNWSAALWTLLPPAVVTVMSTMVPDAPAGAMTWIKVSLWTDQLVGLMVVVPNWTPVAPVNPVPVSATPVPPGPLAGLTIETTGVGVAP